MNEEQFSYLESIFYDVAPPGFILYFEKQPRKILRGYCDYSDRICVLFKQDSVFEGLWTLLHELAHAITGGGHSLAWEQSFIRLLNKYYFPKEEIPPFSQMGPRLKEWSLSG